MPQNRDIYLAFSELAFYCTIMYNFIFFPRLNNQSKVYEGKTASSHPLQAASSLLLRAAFRYYSDYIIWLTLPFSKTNQLEVNKVT